MVVHVESLDRLSVSMPGPSGTPYHRGTFTLLLTIPPRYPFVPPEARFATKLYHPNIDSGGRICCSLLSLPPKGTWSPSLHLTAVCASLQSLLASPNPDDPLDADAAQQFLVDPAGFDATARGWTERYAMPPNDDTHDDMDDGRDDDDAARATLAHDNLPADTSSEVPAGAAAKVHGTADGVTPAAATRNRGGEVERAAAAAAAQAIFDDSSSD